MKCLRSLFLLSMLYAIRPGMAEEQTATEPVVLDFGRPCISIVTEEEASGQAVVKPRMTPKYPPTQTKYPDGALKPGEKRVAQLLLLVNEEGYVSQAKVLTSSGSEVFDQASMEATKKWRLEPGRVNSTERCMWLTFTVTGIGSK